MAQGGLAVRGLRQRAARGAGPGSLTHVLEQQAHGLANAACSTQHSNLVRTQAGGVEGAGHNLGQHGGRESDDVLTRPTPNFSEGLS